MVTALWLSRPLASLLFGVQPADASTAVAVAVLMVLTGVAGAYLRSRRAARIDPVSALRTE